MVIKVAQWISYIDLPLGIYKARKGTDSVADVTQLHFTALGARGVSMAMLLCTRVSNMIALRLRCITLHVAWYRPVFFTSTVSMALLLQCTLKEALVTLG